jgi:hypothetical protein
MSRIGGRVNDISSDHLLRVDRESLETILRRIGVLILIAETHGQRDVVHYLTLAQAETRRLLAIDGNGLPN